MYMALKRHIPCPDSLAQLDLENLPTSLYDGFEAPMSGASDGAGELRKEDDPMADRRSGRGPYVPDEGGGLQPRSRNADGRWRKKRSDAGKKRKR